MSRKTNFSLNNKEFELFKEQLNQEFQNYIEQQVIHHPVQTYEGDEDGEVVIYPDRGETNLAPYVAETKYPILRPLIDDLRTKF